MNKRWRISKRDSCLVTRLGQTLDVVESHHYREYERAHCHPYKNGTQVCGHLTLEGSSRIGPQFLARMTWPFTYKRQAIGNLCRAVAEGTQIARKDKEEQQARKVPLSKLHPVQFFPQLRPGHSGYTAHVRV